jgi:hypothetical protein
LVRRSPSPTGQDLTIKSGFGQLRPNTNLASIEGKVAQARRPLRLQFDQPLPASVLSAAADVLAAHPDVGLRAYGRIVDPTLSWLAGLEHVQHVALDLWHATSFDALSGFTNLRSLSLGATESKHPSLAFLTGLPRLEFLSIEAHDKDFDAVGDVHTLRRFHLRVPRTKSLEALRGHPTLDEFKMTFGGIRDLDPLAKIPTLRGLALYQVRTLDTEDLDILGDFPRLEALSLGALRNVHNLAMLGRGPSATLRFLILEKLTGLTTLADLGQCASLEQLGLYDSRPQDSRLDVLLPCKNLRHLVVGDVYPPDQLEAVAARIAGETLVYRGKEIRGELKDVRVRWRASTYNCLYGPDPRPI